MHIKLNGKYETAVEEYNLFEFLLERFLNPVRYSVRFNGKVIERKFWNNINLQSGDNIDMEDNHAA